MGTFPHHMTVSPNGRWLYVAEYGSHKIGVVDTTLDQRVADFYGEREPARPHACRLDHERRQGPLRDERGFDDVVVRHALEARRVDGRRLWEVPVGPRPSEVLVTNDGKTAYVTIRNENSVRVLDVSGERPSRIAEVAIGTQPDTMRLTPDGKTLVVGLRGTPQLALDGHRHARRSPRHVPGLRDQRPPVALGERQVHVHRARDR